MQDRLIRLFHERKTQHKYRARLAGFNDSPNLPSMLAISREFEYRCVFCGVSFAELTDKEITFCHPKNIHQTGNDLVLFSCSQCNSNEWYKTRDNPDKFLLSLGKSPAEWWARIDKARSRVIQDRARVARALAEHNLAQLENDNQPTLETLALNRLVERLKNVI